MSEMNDESRLAKKAWDVLVEHAGARPDDWLSFEDWFDTRRDFANEFRFCGKLGFGGKLYVTPERLVVSCYPEDESSARSKIIETTNGLLMAIYSEWKEGHA